MEALISVVMPVYNREKYIEESINSIINQTYTNLELIIIDDASTDQTSKILNRISDPRVVVITLSENKGVSTAINIGFREAKGDFIARMDSDDIAFSTRFEKQLKVLQENPDLIVCGSLIVQDNGELLKFKENHKEIYVDMLNRCALSMGTALLKKSKLGNLLLEDGLRHGEDYEFWSRIISKGNFYNIQEPLLYYRSHTCQLSKLYKQKQILMDADIKLTFLKVMAYDNSKFPDVIIKKIWTLTEYFTAKELGFFFKWLKELRQINQYRGIFLKKEFESFILIQRHYHLYNIYFKKNKIGIDKKWRIKAIFYLEWNDIIYIIKQKIREQIKYKGSG